MKERKLKRIRDEFRKYKLSDGYFSDFISNSVRILKNKKPNEYESKIREEIASNNLVTSSFIYGIDDRIIDKF